MKKKLATFFNALGDFLFAWLPTIINVACCAFLLFPWADLADPNKNISDILLDRDTQIALLFITYTVLIAKNYYDLNHKINKKIDNLKAFDNDKYQRLVKKIDNLRNINADDFFCVRNELESLEHILSEAKSIAFSGGHLHAVIIAHSNSLNKFLLNDHTARFILPNPLQDFVISEYAEKLMIKTTKDEFRSLVVLSLKAIKRYKDEGRKIDVRLYNSLPSFGLQIIESDKESKINVELYTLKTALSERILFSVHKKSSREMYDRFEEQFNILWNSSNKIEEIDGLAELLQE